MKLQRIHIYAQQIIKSKLHANRYYNWYVFTRALSENLEKQVMRSYIHCADNTDGNPSTTSKKQVVFICNGNIESGGWADRLKGIISTYQVCKEEGYDFRLYFVHPFMLTEYVVPNIYDWQIKTEDVIFKTPHTDVVAFEIGQESHYQAKKQKKLLSQRLRNSEAKQVHVYCNAMFCYESDYSGMFNELFKPSKRLQTSIDEHSANLGNSYISCSARFIEALGDFTDTQKTDPLPKEKQELLLGNCITAIEKIHNQYPDKKILVNSDSKTFLSRAKQLKYTYVIPGEITHLDTGEPTEGNLYEHYEKTLLDFFMIANAAVIYRLDGKWIHKSGFPLSASKIKNKPFISIKAN